MEMHDRVLVVEGVDDAHAIRNLGYQHGVSICIEGDDYDEKCIISPAGGFSNVGTVSKNWLKLKGEITHLGIVVDADESAIRTYRSVVEALFHFDGNKSYADVAENLKSEGRVDQTSNSADDPVRVGIWIMPDNENSGALEDFAANLIPSDDKLWPFAEETVAKLPEIDDPPEHRFKLLYKGKAVMHTWLAWQETPREPIGRSISNGTLQHDAELACRFMQWMRRLFELPEDA